MEQQTIRHDLANAVSIALAMVEGMADGIVEPNAENLETVAAGLRRAGQLIAQLDPHQR